MPESNLQLNIIIISHLVKMCISKTQFFTIVFLIIITTTIPVHAQISSALYASTNKSSYQPGDKVIVSGSVPQIIKDLPVTIIVRNPMGNVYEVGQVKLLNNLFVHDFVINEDSQGGEYTVNIKYGTQSVQTQFAVNAGELIIIPVLEGQIKVRTNSTNLIKYNDVSVSTVDNTIKISMNTTAVTTKFFNQEYQIPKNVIDYPNGKLGVKTDGNEITCTQTETPTERILDCPIPNNSEELELIGTVVIPEFGPFVEIIVVTALIGMLIIVKRYQTRIK